MLCLLCTPLHYLTCPAADAVHAQHIKAPGRIAVTLPNTLELVSLRNLGVNCQFKCVQ